MKKLVVIFFFLPLASICLAQEWINVDLEDTKYVYATGKTCIKKTGEPLNGNYAIKFNRYQTNYEVFIDGLKNGEFRVFRNKKLAEKGLYRNSLPEGEWLYYNEDGTVRRKIFYKDGKQRSVVDLR
ncbi:MAG: hypothetical protein EOO96_00335 [Pedobacter sp.]|nr:MAG: hypothetical protein EOO96_00335 [Pedobacter sp.]